MSEGNPDPRFREGGGERGVEGRGGEEREGEGRGGEGRGGAIDGSKYMYPSSSEIPNYALSLVLVIAQ